MQSSVLVELGIMPLGYTPGRSERQMLEGMGHSETSDSPSDSALRPRQCKPKSSQGNGIQKESRIDSQNDHPIARSEGDVNCSNHSYGISVSTDSQGLKKDDETMESFLAQYHLTLQDWSGFVDANEIEVINGYLAYKRQLRQAQLKEDGDLQPVLRRVGFVDNSPYLQVGLYEISPEGLAKAFRNTLSMPVAPVPL